MRLWIVSDLHLEFAGNAALRSLAPPDGTDVIMLAGDIDLGVDGIVWARERFAGHPVVYVLGNHEYYGHNWDSLIRHAREAAAGSNVHFLEDAVAEIDAVRVIGCSLWTDFRLFGESRVGDAIAASQKYLADFSQIREGGDRLSSRAWIRRHHESRDFLRMQLEGHENSRTVVVTHHLPSRKSVAPEYEADLLAAGFASELTPLIENTQPAFWVHGHTHVGFDYQIGRTRVVGNPAGYPGPGGLENPKFDPGLVIEV